MSNLRGLSHAPQHGGTNTRNEKQHERPYRSHVRPACLACRRRKSRCKAEVDAGTCLMCRVHGTECTFPAEKRRKSRRTPRHEISQSNISITKKPIAHTPPVPIPSGTAEQPQAFAGPPRIFEPDTPAQPIYSDWTPSNAVVDTPLSLEAEKDNPHILGPTVMNDSHVLADYLSSVPGGPGMRTIRPVEPGSSSSPIIFTKVQKRPVGMVLNSNPALEKLQVIEKLVEPWALNLVNIYFEKVNSCFPILDRSTFQQRYTQAKGCISPALLACLYAHTLAFWRYDPQLSHTRCPDTRYIWNMASDTIYSELHISPGISTITAILLNIGGRPTTSMVGNGIQLGSAVSLCHSLGLNRNPMSWDIPQTEKYLRIKIWWCVVIHDRWLSLAYGTPPHIRRSQYDVPVPTPEYLQDTEGGSATPELFIALVTLTEVLDSCLEHVYSISMEGPAVNLELQLNKWFEELTGDLRKLILRGARLQIHGASNLRLSYLSVRLLLQRISLDRVRQKHEVSPEDLANRTIDARRTAEEIVDLVRELQEFELGDFWLPVAAFTFSSTVTFLIRCAIETERGPVGFSESSSLRMASEFLSALRSHQQNYEWDLANICLAQHAEVVENLLATNTAEGGSTDENIDIDGSFTLDTTFMDTILPSIWDTFQNI